MEGALKNIIRFAPWVLIACIIVSVNVVRFSQLNSIPYSVNVDEAVTGLSFMCISQEGIGARIQKPFPIFDFADFGSARTFIYTFPGALWIKVFGSNPDGLRSFSVLFCLLSILGIFFLAKLLGQGWRAGLLAVLCASISPWMWPLSRLAVETAACPFFLVWGTYFFLRSAKWRDMIMAGLFFGCALYSYAPVRLFLPLALIVLIILRQRIVGEMLPKRKLLMMFIALIAISMPLIDGVLSGFLQTRFNKIAIYSAQYWAKQGQPVTWLNVVGLFFKNYIAYIHPSFLFYHGSKNVLTYATLFPGQIFSWLDSVAIIGAVILGIVKSVRRKGKAFFNTSNQRWACIVLGVFFFIAMIGPSLTWEYTPNVVRTTPAWPFMMVLIGILLQQIVNYVKGSTWLILVLSGCFIFFYLQDYFYHYRDYSKGMFTFWLRDQVEAAKTPQDWIKVIAMNRPREVQIRYFLMLREGMGCQESYKRWEQTKELVEKHFLK